ncbi:MAG TPA: adenylyl-sulfate kinase [Solirubrobacteraceae bacterium]
MTTITRNTSANVTWHEGSLDRARRWQALGQQGATVWLTGLPASGKSTIAATVEQRLVESGRIAYRLDGDNLRHGICGDLGFTHEDRIENVWRVGQLARLFADAGTVALVSLVSPYATCRERVRELHERDGLAFVEVFVDTPTLECERRDPKGLYAKAQAGELSGLTGVDDPYEAPSSPELTLTPSLCVEDAANAVLSALEARLQTMQLG